MKKNTCLFKIILLTILISLFTFNYFVNAEEDISHEEFYNDFNNIDLQETIINDIINFVIEREPVLNSYREVKQKMVELDSEREIDEDIPEYIISSLLKEDIDSSLMKHELKENYIELKRNLRLEIIDKITVIYKLQNQIENQKDLHILLKEREETAKRNVEAGIMEPEILVNLTKEIIETSTKIADAEVESKMIKLELAFNYGNEDWLELYELLQQLTTK